MSKLENVFINISQLLKELQFLKLFTENKPTHPIFSNVLLEIDAATQTVRLTTAIVSGGVLIAGTTTLPCRAEKTNSIVLPFDKMMPTLDNIEGEDLQLEIDNAPQGKYQKCYARVSILHKTGRINFNCTDDPQDFKLKSNTENAQKGKMEVGGLLEVIKASQDKMNQANNKAICISELPFCFLEAESIL